MGRLLVGLLTVVMFSGQGAAQSAVERGNYLVNGILACGNCHSPKGPPAAVAGKAFSGGLRFDEPPFDVTGSNITPDRETGIGGWSDAEIKNAIVRGKRRNGVQLAEIMPSAFYPILTEGDLNAVVAYLRSLPPVKNKVPDPVYKIALPHHVFPGAEKSYTAAELNDPVKKGFYLVTIGHCMECHTPQGQRGALDLGNVGKGGREFKGPWGVSVSRNITSHREKGIGAWTDNEIKAAITQGKRRDGSPLKPPMDYGAYAKITDADLSAMVADLRTVPAKD
jgi:mono/diheme cytochrome c family protein